jgi:hypothetical protein
MIFRRFSAGDSAAELFRRFPPNRREEFGRYAVYSYYRSPEGIQFTGLAVVTRDGKLLSAESGSCTWQFSFFRTADSDFDVQYAVNYKEKRERRARVQLERLATHLRTFYARHGRWPTNQQELSFFINPGVRRSRTTNDLGITLVRLSDEIVEIGLTEFPTEKRSVTRPDRENRVSP